MASGEIKSLGAHQFRKIIIYLHILITKQHKTQKQVNRKSLKSVHSIQKYA